MDNRIGTLDAEGAVQDWPAVDAYGRPYSRPPAITVRLDPQHFTVFQAGSAVDAGLIEALRALVEPVASDGDNAGTPEAGVSPARKGKSREA